MSDHAAWKTMPIDELAQEIIDYRGKSPRKSKSGIPLVTAKIVKNGRIEVPTEFIPEPDYEEWMRRGIPEPGDVVITTEAPLGEVAQLGPGKVALAQRLIVLRARPELMENRFLKYALVSSAVQHQLHARATGTTVLGIRQSELRRVEVPIPPLPTQQRIAHILGTLDDKIELNRRMNRALEAIARAIFKSWFIDFDPVIDNAILNSKPIPDEFAERADVRREILTRSNGVEGVVGYRYLFPDEFQDSKLGPIPEGWEVTEMGAVCRVINGGTPSTKIPEYWQPAEIAWATPTDITGLDSPIISRTARRISEAGLENSSAKLLPAGSVLVTSRATIGFSAVSSVPIATNQGFKSLVCEERASSIFMLHVVRRLKPCIENLASGSTYPEINASTFRRIGFVLPPVALVSRFEALATKLFQAISGNDASTETLKGTRDSLLPRLLSGELPVE